MTGQHPVSLQQLIHDRFLLRRYKGLFEVKHSRTGTIAYGTSIIEALDQMLAAWEN